MPRMRTVDAAVAILRKEGVTDLFGLPGAAINPFYSAVRADGTLSHTLARHVEGAAHMAEGYTRAKAGNIGVCVGTSGPAGTDMITGLYSASADSIPILCITGQAPVAKLHKEDFQAVDIATVAGSLTKMAMTVLEPAQVPGAFQQAFHLMRSGRPGPVLIDLPLDVQLSEIEFDIETYEPLPVYKPAASRAQIEKALTMLAAAERPVIVAGGGIINADASDLLVEFAELTGTPVVPTLMGWGTIPDDHRLMAGMAGIQTSQRYGNANFLASDFVLGIGNRWANRHTGGLETYTAGRKFVHVDIEPTQIGRVFAPDYGIVSDAKAALELFVTVARERAAAGSLPDRSQWIDECDERKRTLLRKTHFDTVPIKPHRVYEEMNRSFGPETVYVSTIGLSQIAAAQFLHVYKPRHWINAGQAGPLGWTVPAALGVVKADPDAQVVAITGDYDFQFMIEELAVGAQFNLPFVHVLVNNAYLGLIRQAQRGFDMDYAVQLSFENINSPEVNGYGVDHVKVAEGLGCKALRVSLPEEILPALEEAKKLAEEFRVPVVVEIVLERVTNIAMGTNLDNMTEFEEVTATTADAPTTVVPITV
ncbi:glyoxylate carboligase [Pseudonocardia alaniniphila]|uniref:Glyoxylate carboligase n=1 Tax=Pseudonocardia alaniniphila TaxID=75291 RepID=A0ABS9TKX7_9PSEU|nr:glyoxylate carboligase [Pseudonocardia alaniniphila]MCH6169180.1 glyoxylate carboligase [Pseudonocardia alaniniphila]